VTFLFKETLFSMTLWMKSLPMSTKNCFEPSPYLLDLFVEVNVMLLLGLYLPDYVVQVVLLESSRNI
jgi:hypothetical protein